MKKKTWIKHHRYFGLVLAFFIIMFCVSGIVLNHPSLFAKFDVNRELLPQKYRYEKWNNALLRGTKKWRKTVLMYGNNGVWLTDSTARRFVSFNKGMDEGAENRNIRGIEIMPAGEVFAANGSSIYRLYGGTVWKKTGIDLDADDRISDISAQGDTLLLTTRSYIYFAKPPYTTFNVVQLPAAKGEKSRVSLFRTVWWLHSGELFGVIGKLIADVIAIILIFLSLSGVLYWMQPKLSKRVHAMIMARLFSWHNSVGRLTIVLTLIICITGWMLRPPMLLFIARQKVPPVPFSKMDSKNAWYDKLRSIRYDEGQNDWLLYTSDGFYSMKTLASVPQKLSVQPPVSVMGLTVQQTMEDKSWLLGSFSGLYKWQRSTDVVTDYFTKLPPKNVQGPPVGNDVIAGFSNDFASGPCVADYSKGSDFAPMPLFMSSLPMSLRGLALEIHTGRIYTFLGSTSVLYIFVIGLAVIWCLWTGWKIRKKR